ncbi:dCTP deaminase [Candidatus Woesearchaeota archaeon]|nr:dCTP deaminase [Candidatus Woesearchaeota archaeon]
MLSDIDIRSALANGDLIINPFLPEQIRPAGVTFHLGEKILKPIGNKVIDLKKKELPEYEEHIMTEDKPYLLRSGDFVLGHTFETIGLSRSIGMMLEGRSTIARLGVTVVQTAMIADSGTEPRRLTLEIKNNGPHDIVLYPQLRLLRAVFFKLNQKASFGYDEEGRYKYEQIKPIFNDNEFRKR